MKLLVLIITYNAINWAEKCFGSLKKSYYAHDVYVVDNGSNDGTIDYIKSNYPSVILYQSKVNLGFGKANNIGLQYAIDNNYDFVYLLNQDAWVFPDTFDKIIEISNNNKSYGILSPFQMESNMNHIDKWFKSVTCSYDSSNELLDYLYLNKNVDVIPVANVMAAHWLIRRETIIKVGGFSPSFPHYGEDYNYTSRVAFHGMKVGIVPSLMVVHDRENRLMSPAKIMYKHYTSNIRYISNPDRDKYIWLKILYREAKEIFYYRSLDPLVYIYKLLSKYKFIELNRKISMTKVTAFLKV